MEHWRAVLDELDAGTERLVATLAGLGDDGMRAPSALPGWSRGHVATHLARNADSLWNLLEWARTGTEISQYPSTTARDEGIEAGAGRSAGELAADVEAAAARLAERARTLPEAAWSATVGTMSGWSHPAWFTLYRRWQEVEAHHVDLAAGYTPADWPDSFVRWELAATLAGLAALPAGLRPGLTGARLAAADLDAAVALDGGGGPEISGPARPLLGWLSGRADGTGLTVRPAGPLPAPPPWPHAPAPGAFAT